MFAKELEKTEPAHMRRVHMARCQMKTGSTGTGCFSGQKRRCSKLAHYEIEGVKLCKLHAGDAALCFLLENA